MPVVRIPTPLRPFAGGKDSLEAPGSTVGEVLNALTADLPDLKDRILDGGKFGGS
jgi:molybdopterin converting factor small subunit